jgi:hypothetical protein
MLTDTWTDLSKAVMEDGEWFLVPAEHVNLSIPGDRESLIVHRCHVWNPELRSPDDLPYEPLGYWASAESVSHRCKLCNVRPPEKIANLFLLHNFDTFAADSKWESLGREIGRGVSKAIHRQELKYFVQSTDGHCTCSDCHDKYGAWQ